MIVMVLMATRADVRGRLVVTRRLKWLGSLATVTMIAAVAAMFLTFSAG